MTAVAIIQSEPGSLVAVHDQCAQVEVWAEQCESVAELKDATNRLAAIDEYLARTSTEGRGRVAATMRRLEVRIGKLLGKGEPGKDVATSFDSLTKDERAKFRKLAENEDTVERVIEEASDTAPPSRRKVLDRIKGSTRTQSGIVDKSRDAVRAREREVVEMVRKGFSSQQIANRLNITQETVKSIAKRLTIDIIADKTMGVTRRHDSNRIIAETVHGLEGTRIALDLIDFSTLDKEQIEGWVSSLTDSIKALNGLKARLVKEQTHE